MASFGTLRNLATRVFLTGSLNLGTFSISRFLAYIYPTQFKSMATRIVVRSLIFLLPLATIRLARGWMLKLFPLTVRSWIHDCA